MSGHLEERVAMLEREIVSLRRLLGTPFAIARTTMAPDDTGPVQTVQVQLDPISKRDAVPLLYAYGMTACPPTGADLHVAFIDGQRSKAIITASAHQSYRLKNLSPGDAALYDSRGAFFWLAGTGPVVNCAGQPMTITGDLHVTGRIIQGYGNPGHVDLGSHTHAQGPDGHSDAEVETNPPTPGT